MAGFIRAYSLGIAGYKNIMNVHLARKRVFSAAHRYWNPAHSPEWNRDTFGRQSEVHGHNYTVEATLSGPEDAATGMVVNLTDVKEWLAEAVAPFDIRLIEYTTPEMKGLQPSTENLARVLWDRISSQARATTARLVKLKVSESEELFSEYTGEGDMVYVTKVYDFAASHRLHAESLSDAENTDVFGKCNNPAGHGHNYGLEVTVKGTVDPDTGFAFPIDALDRIVSDRVLDVLDHKNLNTDVPHFRRVNPTSENLAVFIWDVLRAELGQALHRVGVQETARNRFEYFGQ